MNELKLYSAASPFYVLYQLLDRMDTERVNYPTYADFLNEYRIPWINADLAWFIELGLY